MVVARVSFSADPLRWMSTRILCSSSRRGTGHSLVSRLASSVPWSSELISNRSQAAMISGMASRSEVLADNDSVPDRNLL